LISLKSRLVHRHGGKPIGSLDTDALLRHGTVGNKDADIYPLLSQPVNPLFYDCTHDNETPHQKRVAQDSLPTGALVAMCAASIGSVMGYDEIFPKLLDLVSETRLYARESEQPGIGKVKGILNRLHTEMALEGYTETHVHHEGEVATIQKVCSL
jgi:glycogen debranching enzyme